MRAAVLSWGTRGDVQPLLAVAVRLAQAGVDVVFGADAHHADFVRGYGLRFSALGTPMSAGAYLALMDGVHAEPNPRKQNRFLIQQVLLPDLDRQYADCLRTAQGTDIVVAHWLQVGAGLAAQTLQIPWASVTLHASGIACEQGLGDDARAQEAYSNWLWGDRLYKFRQQHGLHQTGTVAQSIYSPTLNLVAMSRHLVPDCVGWPHSHQAAGFFYLDEVTTWRPDPKLQDFVDQHGDVVVVTLGSSAGSIADRVLDSAIEVLAQTGQPAIVQSSSSRHAEFADSRRTLYVGDVPHSWLFRHARCVIHHGGAGTTAAALRAGVPQVVIGNLFDQPYWGNLLAAHRLAPRPILDGRCDVATLVERVESAAAFSGECRRFAGLIASEPGAADAARRLVDGLVNGPAKAQQNTAAVQPA
jgi:sterol 3beta-glucosyltransferase